jgi:pimeloyl-ACP methyl ester carboxylesterase
LSIAYRISPGFRPDVRSILAAACGGEAFNVADIVDPVIQLDLRGQGGSDKPREVSAYSIDSYSQDFFAVADATGVERPVLLGYSHAADAAAHAAIVEPERVEGLILIEPAFFVDRAHLKRRIELIESGDIHSALRLTFQFANPKISSRQLERGVKMAREYYGDDTASLLGEFQARAFSDIDEERLRSLRIPTLIIGGTQSNIRSNVARAAQVIPEASVIWIPGADHFLEKQRKHVGAFISAFMNMLS